MFYVRKRISLTYFDNRFPLGALTCHAPLSHLYHNCRLNVLKSMWLLVACTQFCSVLSVYLSKKLFDYVGSTNCCTVAGLQLATRWLILEILSLSGQMEQLPKRRDTLIRKLGFGTIFFAIAYAMSHTVGVASLYYNTLLFDQTTKIGTVPATLLLQSLVRGAQSPPFVWLALITTLSGCMLFFWSDSSSTFYGGTICLAGFVVRTYVDLWTVDSDGELIKPVTTMYCLGPPCALFLLVLAHFIDEDRCVSFLYWFYRNFLFLKKKKKKNQK